MKIDYLNMPDDKKKRLPSPTLLLHWIDLEEMQKMKSLSLPELKCFSRIGREGGKHE